MKKIGFLLLILTMSVALHAQDKYEIKIKINGINDTVIYLAHHFGGKQYITDTAYIDNKGNAIFKGEKVLGKGIYLIAMPSYGLRYFELIVGNNKFFSIETDTVDFINSMKIKNSPENIVFNEYQKKMIYFQTQQKELSKKYETVKDNEEETKKIIEKSEELNMEQEKYMKEIIQNHPDHFFSTVIKAMLKVDVPDAPTDEEGNIIDPLFQYLYSKDHFFDNIDFSENGLLRTPIYESKIDYFFSKMVVPEIDSLIKETKKVINLSYEGGDSLMYQYTLSHLLNTYDTSRIMGYDAIFVAIAEDWYLSGKAPWADSTLMANIADKVEKVTPNRIGNIAPNLIRMQSLDNNYYTLHQIPGDYTILVFFEPSCGHCKKEIPKLITEFRDTLKKFNVSIFAVYTQYDKEEWKKFVDEKNLTEDGWYNVWDGPYPHSSFRDLYNIYSTPVIFVLDKDKKIIGKRIGAEDIKGFLEFYNKKLQHQKENKSKEK